MNIIQKRGLITQLISAPDRYNGVECTFLIRGRDNGRDAWHYVQVKRHLVPLFLKKSKSGNIDVASYGTIILSGWGANPNRDQVDEIEDMFRQKRLDTVSPDDQTPLHIAVFKGGFAYCFQ